MTAVQNLLRSNVPHPTWRLHLSLKRLNLTLHINVSTWYTTFCLCMGNKYDIVIEPFRTLSTRHLPAVRAHWWCTLCLIRDNCHCAALQPALLLIHLYRQHTLKLWYCLLATDLRSWSQCCCLLLCILYSLEEHEQMTLCICELTSNSLDLYQPSWFHVLLLHHPAEPLLLYWGAEHTQRLWTGLTLIRNEKYKTVGSVQGTSENICSIVLGSRP